MKICGVYKIRNKINAKVIIGSSKNIKKRWNAYRSTLNKGVYSNLYLQNSWDKYGASNFEFSILEECSEAELLIKEDKWMEHYKSMDSKYGYNLKTAERQIPSKETRKKMSGAKKGKSPWNKGKTNIYSEETLRKISEARMGTKMPEKTRLKISERSKGNKNMLGHKHSEKSKEKMSKSRLKLGFCHTEETKKTISESHKGKKFTKEHKKKLSDAHKGKKFTKEHRENLSKARKGRVLKNKNTKDV